VSPTELIGIAIGWALLALGAASLGASALRRQHPARLLLTFGIWCALYGTRLIAAQPALRALLGGSPRLWLYVVAFHHVWHQRSDRVLLRGAQRRPEKRLDPLELVSSADL